MNTALLRKLDLTNLFTLSGLLFSMLAAIFAIEGQYYASVLCILYCGCVDLFDGFLARRMNRTELHSALGEPLDSLVDMCSFGFAPVILGYSFGLRDWLSVIILGLYLVACAARLAYFDSTGFYKIGETEYYIGLPVTFAALFLPNVFVLNFFVAKSTMLTILTLVYLGMAIAMVAGFRMAKQKAKKDRKPRRYLLLPVGALVLTIIYGYASIVGGI